MAKMTLAQAWMRDHPDDTPCPKSGGAAYWWRMKRGIGGSHQWAQTKKAIRAAEQSSALERSLRACGQVLKPISVGRRDSHERVTSFGIAPLTEPVTQGQARSREASSDRDREAQARTRATRGRDADDERKTDPNLDRS
jgi:hypothetical protein